MVVTIDKDSLLKYAKLNGLRPWQQEKHYIQSAILVSLAEKSFVFKGGTYLWFFHGLDRFSEDLDFTSQDKINKELATKVSEDLRFLGIENTVKIMSDDERTLSLRFSARGPLYTSEIDICHVYVEISKREQVVRRPMALELKSDAYGLPVKIISGMDLNEVAAEKVRAVITRDRARDVYDLAYLITKKNVEFDEELVNEKLKYYNLRFSKETFLAKVREKEKEWKKELQSLVFGKLSPFSDSLSRIERWVAD